MYIKYVPNRYSNTAWSIFFQDMAGILNGTITSVSQLNSTYCDQTTSEIVGTLPTAGMYTVTSNTVTTLIGRKKHYANNGAFQPEVIFSMNITTSGLYLGVKDANSANALDIGHPTGSAVRPEIASGNNFYFIYQIDIWIGDTGIMIATQKGPIPINTASISTVNTMNVFCDFPYIPEYDDKCFSDNSGYYPAAYFASGGYSVSNFGLNSTTPQHHTMFFRRNNFRRDDGAFSTLTSYQGPTPNGVQYGNIAGTAYSQNYPQLFPPPQASHYSVPTAAVGAATILHPCMYTASWTGGRDTRSGQMLNMFRIADSFGSGRNGDRLQVGSDYYRVIKAHKTGRRSMAEVSAINAACYAFPENSIPGPS